MRGVTRRRGSLAEYFQGDKRLFFNASLEPELPFDPASNSRAWSRAANVRPNCILSGTGWDFDIGSSAYLRPVAPLADRPMKGTIICHYWGRSRNSSGQIILSWCISPVVFRLYLSASGAMTMTVRVGGAARLIAGGPVVPLQQPIILAVTYDGENGGFYTSWGDSAIKPSPLAGSIDHTGAVDFRPYIGGAGVSAENVTGIVGDSALFNDALSPAELRDYFAWCQSGDNHLADMQGSSAAYYQALLREVAA